MLKEAGLGMTRTVLKDEAHLLSPDELLCLGAYKELSCEYISVYNTSCTFSKCQIELDFYLFV
jgi:hypothetical protein